MRKLSNLYSFLAAAVFTMLMVMLNGCTSLSKAECKVANWHDIGYADGAKGFTIDRIGEHREACAKIGVSPKLQVYLEGHALGLRTYCRPKKGFEMGRAGRLYMNVCPTDMEQRFVEYYQQGQKIKKRDDELQAVRSESVDVIKILKKDKIDEYERERLNRELRRLQRETASLERQRDREVEMIISDLRYAGFL